MRAALISLPPPDGAAGQLVARLEPGDLLLVLAPGLVASPQLALAALGGGASILAAEAGEAQAAGFERIDADCGWAGIMVLPAAPVMQLGDLAPDIAPASALLRLGLQHAVPVRRLATGTIGTARWCIPGRSGGPDLTATERAYFDAALGHPPEVDASPLAARLAEAILRRRGHWLIPRADAPAALAGGALGAGALALGLAGWDQPAAAFALVALMAALAQLALVLARIGAAPASPGRAWAGLRLARDGVLVAACALVQPGPWYRAGFVACVLGAGLLLLDRADGRYARLVGDRLVLAGALALATLAIAPEPALMLAALAALGTVLVAGRSRITGT